MQRILFVFFILISLVVKAQWDDDTIRYTKGWNLGINAGVYFASKNQAAYYDGRPSNENNIDYVFSNTYWYQDIKNKLMDEVSRDNFWIAEYPMDMHYNPSLYAGFSARYNFSADFSINVHFNFGKLKLIDAFNIEVDPPLPGSVHSYIPCSITGEESRSNIDFSMLFAFPDKNHSPLKPFAELGFNLNSVNVKSSQIQIYDLVFNLRNVYGDVGYIPNTGTTEYTVKQGGVGFGLFSAAGVRYEMSRDFSIELCCQLYYSTIHLTGYTGFGLHYAPMLRLVLSPSMINLN